MHWGTHLYEWGTYELCVKGSNSLVLWGMWVAVNFGLLLLVDLKRQWEQAEAWGGMGPRSWVHFPNCKSCLKAWEETHPGWLCCRELLPAAMPTTIWGKQIQREAFQICTYLLPLICFVISLSLYWYPWSLISPSPSLLRIEPRALPHARNILYHWAIPRPTFTILQVQLNSSRRRGPLWAWVRWGKTLQRDRGKKEHTKVCKPMEDTSEIVLPSSTEPFPRLYINAFLFSVHGIIIIKRVLFG